MNKLQVLYVKLKIFLFVLISLSSVNRETKIKYAVKVVELVTELEKDK